MTSEHKNGDLTDRLKRAAAKVMHLGGGPRKIRVLLAEDHVVVRQALSARLAEEPDIEVIDMAASEGRLALELTRRHRPDVVVMDFNMPGMNGREATQRIKEEMPHVVIIALSMSNDPHTIESMLKAGASAFLDKSVTVEELLKTIRKFAPR